MTYLKHLLMVALSIVAAEIHPVEAQGTMPPYQTMAEKAAWGSRNRKFAQLYLSRFQKNVTKELLDFALGNIDRNADLRTRAIIALGRIEDPQAEEPLQKLLLQLEEEQNAPPQDQVPIYRIKLALGRIRSQNLIGQARLESIAKSIDLSWAQVQGFGDQLKDATTDYKTRDLVRGSYQLEVVKEFIDVVRSMQRDGDKVDDLGVAHLIYSPLVEPSVSASRLSRIQEAEFWLTRSSAPTDYVFDPALLAGLGNEIKPILLKHLYAELEKLKNKPQLFQSEVGKIALDRAFRAASATGDLQFASVIAQFAQSGDTVISRYANRALESLASGEGTVILPRKPLSGI